MKLIILSKYVLLFYTIIILNSCILGYCDIRDESIGGFDRRFKQVAWKKFSVDRSTMQFVLDYPEQYYDVLTDREKMICNLTQRVLKKGDDYQKVKKILGDGSLTTSFAPSNYVKSYSLNEELFNYCVLNTKAAFQEKKLLVYTVGYNASGNCYLGLVFDNKQYQGCFRAFAI